jgi:hypothetical protein
MSFFAFLLTIPNHESIIIQIRLGPRRSATFRRRMLLSLFSVSTSISPCPAGSFPKGVQYLYNSVTNLTLQNGDWFYFYSDYILLGDTLTVRVLPSKSPASLYTGAGLSCPDDESKSVVNISGGEWGKFTIDVSSSLGLQIFGVRANGDTEVVVSVEGKNPNNADRSEWILLSSLFLVAILLLLIAMFVHAILARGKVHYQVDVGD